MRVQLLVFIIGGLLFISGAYFWIANFHSSNQGGAQTIVKNLRDRILQTFNGSRLAAEIPLDESSNQGSLSQKSRGGEGSAQSAKTSAVTKEICEFHAGTPALRTSVIFSEIAWMGEEKDSTREWVELTNTGSSSVSIKDFEVADKDNQINVVFPNVTLGAHEYYLMARSSETVGNRITYNGNLKNSDEALRLFDSHCALLDEVSAAPAWPAGDSRTKATMERNPIDFSWYSSKDPGGTPGKENSGAPIISAQTISESTSSNSQPSSTSAGTNTINNQGVSTTPNAGTSQSASLIYITEVMVGRTDNAGHEFIELYNASDLPADLTGWSIKKKTSTGSESTLVSSKNFEGKVMPGESYLLLGHSGGYNSSPPADISWPASYTLAYTKNGVSILNNEGAIVDSVFWDDIPKDQSFARNSLPNGPFQVSTPSPKN